MINTLRQQRILPAVTFSSLEDVVAVTNALVRGGLSIMEVTLRTENAFEAIKLIRQEFPDLSVGAGTILNVAQLHRAREAGATFGLSPSLNLQVVEQANRLSFPFIPGVMTPSEIETAANHGCSVLKLFPASCIGGVSFLRALQGPYGHLNVEFIPMGGVNLQNMKDYLAIESVVAVGGSWLAHETLIRNKELGVIEQNARESIAIGTNKTKNGLQ